MFPCSGFGEIVPFVAANFFVTDFVATAVAAVDWWRAAAWSGSVATVVAAVDWSKVVACSTCCQNCLSDRVDKHFPFCRRTCYWTCRKHGLYCSYYLMPGHSWR